MTGPPSSPGSPILFEWRPPAPAPLTVTGLSSTAAAVAVDPPVDTTSTASGEHVQCPLCCVWFPKHVVESHAATCSLPEPSPTRPSGHSPPRLDPALLTDLSASPSPTHTHSQRPVVCGDDSNPLFGPAVAPVNEEQVENTLPSDVPFLVRHPRFRWLNKDPGPAETILVPNTQIESAQSTLLASSSATSVGSGVGRKKRQSVGQETIKRKRNPVPKATSIASSEAGQKTLPSQTSHVGRSDGVSDDITFSPGPQPYGGKVPGISNRTTDGGRLGVAPVSAVLGDRTRTTSPNRTVLSAPPKAISDAVRLDPLQRPAKGTTAVQAQHPPRTPLPPVPRTSSRRAPEPGNSKPAATGPIYEPGQNLFESDEELSPLKNFISLKGFQDGSVDYSQSVTGYFAQFGEGHGAMGLPVVQATTTWSSHGFQRNGSRGRTRRVRDR